MQVARMEAKPDLARSRCQIHFLVAYPPGAAEPPLIQLEGLRQTVVGRAILGDRLRRREIFLTAVAEVGVGRLEAVQTGRPLRPCCGPLTRPPPRRGHTPEDRADLLLGLFVVAFTKVPVPNGSVPIDQVVSGPEAITEAVPDG